MAGILSGEFIFTNVSPAAILLTLLISIILSPLLRKSGTVHSVLMLFMVYIIGLCSYRTAIVNTEIAKKGFYKYQAVVTSNIKHKNNFSTFDIIKISHGKKQKIKATMRGNVILNAGDRLHIISKINPPEDKKKGRFSYATYLKRNGYAGTTFIDKDNIKFAGNYNADLSLFTRFKIKLLQMRSSLLAKLHEDGLSGRDFATVSAMAFGDKTYLTSADREMYNRTGVSHVLALSGLHIGIVYAFLMFFMVRIPKVTRFFFIQVAIWFYVVFAGMSPSLIRAALMITIYSAGMLLHRDKISVNSLSFAGTISLLISPQTLFDICFQLSFLSVFSIILFYRPLSNMIPSQNFILRKIIQMMSVSIAAYVGTMPIILYNFGSISFCFIITNLLVVPLTSVILYLAILSVIPLIGNYIVYLLSISMHLLNCIVNKMSALQFASIDNVFISSLTVILLYIIIISVYCIYLKLSSYYKT